MKFLHSWAMPKTLSLDHWYVLKSNSSRDFKIFPFTQSCKLIVQTYNAYQIFSGVSKISWKSSVMEFLKSQKIPEIMCAVEFFLQKQVHTGSQQNSCSEQLFEKLPSVLEKVFNMDVLLWSCFQKFSKSFSDFSKTLMDICFRKFKHPFV